MPTAFEPIETPSPNHPQISLLRQLAIQFSAAIGVISLAWPYYGLQSIPLPWPECVLAIGVIAFLLARFSRQPWWWQLIHTIFAPAAWSITLLNVDPSWFLVAFGALWLIFRSTATGQVPLYLSNTTTTDALLEILRPFGNAQFVDLGAGIGSTVAPLARALPAMQFTGIENAIACWAIGKLRLQTTHNAHWQLGSLWAASLTSFDLVYAFLSPTPMPQLWEKARQEMKPGSLFISNSFPVPDVEPTEIMELDDRRKTRLYCYRIPSSTNN